MMLCLARDVIGDRLLLRLADTERAVAFLPVEVHSAFVQPARAVALSLLNSLRQWHRRRHVYQEVDVIGCASGGEQGDLFRVRYSGQVSAHFDGIRDEIGPFLRAEDAMHQHPGVRVRHVRRLSGVLRDMR